MWTGGRQRPTEPEIIPPGREPADLRGGQADPWAQHNVYGTQRIFVRRIGPLGLLAIAGLIGLVAALVFVTVVGALFFMVPIIALVLVGALIGGVMRRNSRR
jgi:hypothetical protein